VWELIHWNETFYNVSKMSMLGWITRSLGQGYNVSKMSMLGWITRSLGQGYNVSKMSMLGWIM